MLYQTPCVRSSELGVNRRWRPGGASARRDGAGALRPRLTERISSRSPPERPADYRVTAFALDRLVSPDDYAEFARTYAGVGKASAATAFRRRRQLVSCDSRGRRRYPDRSEPPTCIEIWSSLSCDSETPIRLCKYVYRKLRLLVISAGVPNPSGVCMGIIEPKIRAAVLDRFSFDNRSLGQSAFLSEAIAG